MERLPPLAAEGHSHFSLSSMTRMTLPDRYTRIVLAERPEKEITRSTFRTETLPFDLKPGPGEILVRVDWLSLDPAMRGWLRESGSYLPPVPIGAVMRSLGLGTVVEAGEGCELRPGDRVSGRPGKT
jgi:NADPH-dependent curcumin reductase CurA